MKTRIINCLYRDTDGLCKRHTLIVDTTDGDYLRDADMGSHLSATGTTVILGWGPKLDGDAVEVTGDFCGAFLVPVKVWGGIEAIDDLIAARN